MPQVSLIFPDDFREYEWLLPEKGWFPGATLVVDGRRYSLTFYDRVRLNQTIDDDLAAEAAFFETNLVVVDSVTRANMVRAAEHLVDSGRIGLLAPETPVV